MRRLVILAVLGGMLAGCGGGESGAPPTGPGGPAPVAAVTVTPPADTVLIGAAVQLTATLKDAAGNTLTGRSVIWTSSDPRIASVGTTGMVAGVSLGTTTITATAEGKSGTATTSVMAVLAAVSGDNQTDTVGQALGQPLVAKVTGVDGGGVAGIPVTFAVTAGGGALSSSAASTDANGLASAILTLGTAAGPNLVTASGSGLTGSPVTFTATAVADAPAALDKISGDGQNGFTSRALFVAPVVQVRDRFQNAVPGISVGWVVTGGGGTVAAPATTTNSSGLATVSWTLGVTPGANGLEASGGGLTPVSFSATAVAPWPGRIAFMTDLHGDFEIYVMIADGTGVTRLTNDPTQDFAPAWSPDGSKIAFTTGRFGNLEVAVMNADGTGVTRLTNDTRVDEVPAWSPDGSRIAFERESASDRWDIYVMNADGSGVGNVTSNMTNAGNPTWSPDGSKIAFWGRMNAGEPGEIYVINADGTNLTRLTNVSDARSPAWSPDGSRIAVTRSGGIYLMNPDGTAMTQVPNGAGGSPTWSPDGSRIAFRSSRDGNGEIYSMNPDGTGVVRLTNLPANENSPAWGR